MNATAMQASYKDARPFCPTPLIGGGAQKPKPEPVKVVATPYVWRDPTTIKPREWVYGRSIQRGHVRAILAPGAAGKTILSVGEALAMATGRNLLGQEVPGGPKRVWLWNLEDDAEELAGQEDVFVDTKVGFEVDGIQTKARLDIAAAAIDWRGAYMNRGE